MSPVLKLNRHNEAKEIWFELKYQLSLTTRQRFEMMFNKTKEMLSLLEKSGHISDSFRTQVIKRVEGSGRPKDLEDLKFLRRIKRIKHKSRKKIK